MRTSNSDYFIKWNTFLISAVLAVHANARPSRPHIVFILADDMGWRDVSYHGSDQILTPNIDALAYSGIILQHYYSEAICTPARTALLTGKYPWRLGMQGFPLMNGEDRGIPLTERLLPSYFKDLGYTTHLVGKWHVGMSRDAQLPTFRGFDTHYGIRGGFVDYLTYNKVENWPTGEEVFGFDLYDGMEPQTDERRYITDTFTARAMDIINNHNESTPMFLELAYTAPHAGNNEALLQPPPGPVEHAAIAHTDRRLYAQMVSHFDAAVGKVLKSLSDKGILNDTIIVFASDNGAPTIEQFSNTGLNLPFRGIKATPWEGAVRVPAFVWHSSFRPSVWDGLMHITDWLPTLLAAAGRKATLNIDGKDQWEAIKNNKESKRDDVVITIDNMENQAAYRLGDYKIVVGNLTGPRHLYPGKMYLEMKDGYNSPDYFSTVKNSEAARVLKEHGKVLDEKIVYSMRENTKINQLDRERDAKLCMPTPERGCLFNVRCDPTEQHDLWEEKPDAVRLLKSRLDSYASFQDPRSSIKVDKRSNPANFNYIWKPWLNKVPEENYIRKDGDKRDELIINMDSNENTSSVCTDEVLLYRGESSVKGIQDMIIRIRWRK